MHPGGVSTATHLFLAKYHLRNTLVAIHLKGVFLLSDLLTLAALLVGRNLIKFWIKVMKIKFAKQIHLSNAFQPSSELNSASVILADSLGSTRSLTQLPKHVLPPSQGISSGAVEQHVSLPVLHGVHPFQLSTICLNHRMTLGPVSSIMIRLS